MTPHDIHTLVIPPAETRCILNHSLASDAGVVRCICVATHFVQYPQWPTPLPTCAAAAEAAYGTDVLVVSFDAIRHEQARVIARHIEGDVLRAIADADLEDMADLEALDDTLTHDALSRQPVEMRNEILKVWGISGESLGFA